MEGATSPVDERPPHLTPVPDPPGDDGHPTLPTNTEYERWVLGAILDPTQPDTITQLLTHTHLDGEAFYDPAHEQIWYATHHLHGQGHPTDPTTVLAELNRRGTLTNPLRRRLDGAPLAYLWKLTAAAPLPDNALYYAHQLATLATQRRHLSLAAKIQQDPTGDVLHLLQEHLATETAVAADTTIDTWTAVDLTAIVDGTYTGPQPTTITLRSGKSLLYPEATHSISGEPGSGKSFFAQYGVAQELTAGRPCTYIDFEDRPASVVHRLRQFGCTPDQILTGLRYVRPETALTPTTRAALPTLTAGCSLVVIDGITEAMTLQGMSLMDNEDIARWLALLPRYIADQGPAVLQIDHVVKNSDNRGRYAIGGQHKLAGITGAAYKLLTVKSMGKGLHGHAKVVLDKDRHGEIGPTGATIADFHLDATANNDTTPDAPLSAWLQEPSDIEITDDGTWRPTGYMAKISRFLHTSPGCTGKGITDAVNGKRAHILHALGILISEGYVRTENGPRGAVYHYPVTPFMDPSDDNH